MRYTGKLFLVSAFLLLAFMSLPGKTSATEQFKCFPTCDETDARFLTIAGSQLSTLTDQSIVLRVVADAETSLLKIGVFDGDTRGVDGSGNAHWDSGGGNTQLVFTLYADKDVDGEPDNPAGPLATFNGATLPDNDWFDFDVANTVDAQAPSGNFFYLLHVTMIDPAESVSSSFKVRSDGIVLSIANQPFAFKASIATISDLAIVYGPDTTDFFTGPFDNPTYDGAFTFYFDVFQTQNEFVVWDGDLDRGNYDGSELDSNDPDTPDNPFLPPWAVATTAFEGVAVGSGNSTGAPADDSQFAFARRSPSVWYELITPDNQVFVNSNPSGDREWEQFRIANEPFNPSTMDYHVDSLPPGTYKVILHGMDMNNLNAWHSFNNAVCVDESGTPCTDILRAFIVGDTVWLDSDGDGLFDPGEQPIGGVVVNLRDNNGNLLATTTTDINGQYSFEVDAGQYIVEVAAENFADGGALNGLSSTTGGEQQTNAVVNDNILTYDFGYRPPTGGQGCTPGYWKQPQHFDSWVGYNPNNSFDQVFGVTSSFGGSLLDAASRGGVGEAMMARH
ncbi:MAG: carboxypeptidase regulatory-like domain-containing protein, partial [Nitrososphaera sp.]|nr:carboxypeptidase regulatory-like domain-containing protein [Nitrososphaera sp.]